jgi:hypothetical protein
MYLAIFIGIVLGSLLASKNIDKILTLIYHYRYRKEDDYTELFDIADSEYSYDVMKTNEIKPKSYSQFLLWHQDAKPKAGEIFTKYWSAIKIALSRVYLVFFVLPALLFWSNAAWFLITVVVVHVVFWVHRRIVKKNDLTFYVTIVQTLVIAEHLKPMLKRKNI